MPMVIDEQLNENQHKAVLWEDGPLLVLAGPGSGKTRVLTLRIARLLQERDDVSILALTFTSKAAAEMRERVDSLLGQRGDRVHLCTFHSFAVDILRQHGSHLGIRPDFALLTQDEDRIAFLEEVTNLLRQEGHRLPTDQRSLLSLLDRLFAESYDGGPVAPSLTYTPDWLPSLFNHYSQALIDQNRMDFGSLLWFACQLLRTKPGVARVVKVGWTHICVDEFQDTNKAQYDLLRQIVFEQNPNLFVVGDDDQIIYQWNGASPERLQELRTDYAMTVLQLPENYRCPPEIIDVANHLISHNQMRTQNKQPLTTSRSDSLGQSVVRIYEYESVHAEVSAVAKDISDRGINPIECVVLARNGKLLESAATALRSEGMEAYLAKRKSQFESPVIRVVLHAMRLANAPHDRDVLRRLCIAWQDLTDISLEAEDVAATATLFGGDFLRAWTQTVDSTSQGAATELVDRVRSMLVDRLLFPEIVEWFLLDGWKPWADSHDHELLDEIDTWNEIHDGIVREHGADTLTLNVYLQDMDLAPKSTVPAPNAVRCMTVHGSKGMEFKHVYLIGMAQEVFPSYQALRKGPKSRELEEERRNCFVAITRTQESLTLTRARSYNGYPKGPSQFLAEMGVEVGQRA